MNDILNLLSKDRKVIELNLRNKSDEIKFYELMTWYTTYDEEEINYIVNYLNECRLISILVVVDYGASEIVDIIPN